MPWNASSKADSMQDDVSVMSPNTSQGSPRAKHLFRQSNEVPLPTPAEKLPPAARDFTYRPEPRTPLDCRNKSGNDRLWLKGLFTLISDGMSKPSNVAFEITPEVLLKAYSVGIFPMAESAKDPGLFWLEPEMRGVLPLADFHISKRLARTVRQDRFEIRVDHDFDAVIEACAESTAIRKKTWINRRIRRLYGDLFTAGHAHTVEAWREDRLVGGLYGVRLGAAFFGESMFFRERDASKVALVHLVARLRYGGFTLLDTQFTTEHLRGFGAIDIPRDEYQRLLDAAVEKDADFYGWAAAGVTGAVALQSISQTS